MRFQLLSTLFSTFIENFFERENKNSFLRRDAVGPDLDRSSPRLHGGSSETRFRDFRRLGRLRIRNRSIPLEKNLRPNRSQLFQKPQRHAGIEETRAVLAAAEDGVLFGQTASSRGNRFGRGIQL